MVTNANATIYHKVYNSETRLDEWHRQYIKGVNWFEKRAVSVGENGLNSADELIVRIPIASFDGELDCAPGDYILRGIFSDNVKGASDLIKLGAHLVTAVRDNRIGSPFVQHWKIEGK